jgi:hypothetical protein
LIFFDLVIKMTYTRRDFLKTAGIGTLGALATLSMPFVARGVEDEENSFVVDASKIPAKLVYHGTLPSSGNVRINSLEFVKWRSIYEATPEYKESEKKGKGTGGYTILIGQASARATKIIEEYGKMNRVDYIMERTHLLDPESSGLIVSVPKIYDGKSLDEIVARLDSTKYVEGMLSK